ncbi:hypothetical protein BASA61_002321 [Batrachochytrium salamandrivorans]|nr:hypothetical protein BASA61_002321 [Batrachochytrium salamandrivorans]
MASDTHTPARIDSVISSTPPSLNRLDPSLSTHSSHDQQGLQGPHGSKEDKKYQKQQKRKVEHQKRRLRKEALWDWEARQLSDPNLYGYRHGKLTYPEYLFNKKRPDLVEPSDEALAQLGTTNKNKDDRIKSWEKTEDDKAPHKRPEHESNFYQNRQTEYQTSMQLDNGKRRHSEHIRRLEGKRQTTAVLNSRLEYESTLLDICMTH